MHSNTNGSRRIDLRSPRVLLPLGALGGLLILFALLGIFRLGRGSGRWVEPFAEAPGDSPCYAGAGNGLAVASENVLRLYNAKGECIRQEAASLTEPLCAADAYLSAYYSSGAPDITVVYSSGEEKTLETEGSVNFVHVNENGLLTVLTEKEGCKGCIMVYDRDLTPLFRWEAQSGIPVSARVSQKDRLCILCLSDYGSTAHFYRIDSAEPLGVYPSSGELLLDFGFLSDGTAAFISEERLLLLEEDGSELSSLSLGGHRPTAWSLTGAWAAAGTDGQELLLLAPDGTEHRAAVSAVPEEMSQNRQFLLVLYPTEATLYSAELEDLLSCQTDGSVLRVFLRTDGTALFCGVDGTDKVDFSR